MTEISNILIVSPPEYTHSQTFYDIAMSFANSFPVKPVLTTDPSQLQDGMTLIFGAHLLPKFNATIDGDYILYQTEQLSANNSLFVDSPYLELLKRFPVWEYSLNNMDVLAGHGILATYVPIGYSKSLSNIPTGKSVSLKGGGKNGPQILDFAEWSGAFPITNPATGKFVEDIDICFFGSMNERRSKIINAFIPRTVEFTAPDGSKSTRPLNVASFMGYGGFRDKIIARSKIVLNIHYYDSAIFEIFRCAHLFANKKCVVSEIGNDQALEQPYYQTGCMVEYSGIVDQCITLLNDDAARLSTAQRSYDTFKQTLQSETLKRILA